MSFVDVLKQARSGRNTVLHEFWTNYDPRQLRAYAFFEGYSDRSFYKQFIDTHARGQYRVYTYRCEGKERVYDAFREITSRYPRSRHVMFFVDKDFDDILGATWPTDPRIFVTDVYSIENYIVSRQVLGRVFDDLVRFRDFAVPIEALLEEFECQLRKFYRHAIPLMGWVVFLRRCGVRPNIANIDLKEVFTITTDCVVRFGPRRRLAYVDKASGVKTPNRCNRQIRETTRELMRLPPKRIIRGKCEMWFFVEFLKRMILRLQAEARLKGGSVKLLSPIEHGNAVELLASRVEVPRSLDFFLSQHFPVVEASLERPTMDRPKKPKRIWQRIIGLIRMD